MTKLGSREGTDQRRPTCIVAVVNQKGGVGKTTTSVNVAASIAAAERRTLLIDLDPRVTQAAGSECRRARSKRACTMRS